MTYSVQHVSDPSMVLRDGDTLRDHVPEGDGDDDGALFYWTEGNNSCDCNRAMLLNHQHGLNLPAETCGETITLTQLWRNAREIYP